VIPFKMQILTDTGAGPPFTATLRDISETGLGLTSQISLSTGVAVSVEVCVNNLTWKGRMKVVHCTATISGHKVGLELAERPPMQSPRTREEEAVERLRDEIALERTKTQIVTAIRAYQLAHRTWGFLGTALKKRMRHVLTTLAPDIEAEAGPSGRKEPRLAMTGDVHVVVPVCYGWKWMAASIVDVSESGVQVVFNRDGLTDPKERELTGEFDLKPGTPMIVGIGMQPDTLWVPARILHCEEAEQSMVRVGATFVKDHELMDFEVPQV
jgi:hypothetical protein